MPLSPCSFSVPFFILLILLFDLKSSSENVEKVKLFTASQPKLRQWSPFQYWWTHVTVKEIPVVSVTLHVMTLTAECTSVKLGLVHYVCEAALLWTTMEELLLIWSLTSSDTSKWPQLAETRSPDFAVLHFKLWIRTQVQQRQWVCN